MKTPMDELFIAANMDPENPEEKENMDYWIAQEKEALREAWNNADGGDFELYYTVTYGKR